MSVEIGTHPMCGWVVVGGSPRGVRISVGNRGEGHDEPSVYMAATLCLDDAVRLADAILVAAEKAA